MEYFFRGLIFFQIIYAGISLTQLSSLSKCELWNVWIMTATSIGHFTCLR